MKSLKVSFLKLFSFKIFQSHFKELTFLIIHCNGRVWLIYFSSVLEWKASHIYTIHLLVLLFSCVLHLALFPYPLLPACSPLLLLTLLSLKMCVCASQAGLDLEQGDFWFNGVFPQLLSLPKGLEGWTPNKGNCHPLPFQQVCYVNIWKN